MIRMRERDDGSGVTRHVFDRLRKHDAVPVVSSRRKREIQSQQPKRQRGENGGWPVRQGHKTWSNVSCTIRVAVSMAREDESAGAQRPQKRSNSSVYVTVAEKHVAQPIDN